MISLSFILQGTDIWEVMAQTPDKHNPPEQWILINEAAKGSRLLSTNEACEVNVHASGL